MKQIFKSLMIAMAVFAIASCKEPGDGIAKLESFGFSPASNPALATTVQGVFEGNNIYVTFPEGTDRSSLKASFTTSLNDAVYINNIELTSGQTAFNYANDEYQITVSDRDGLEVNYNLYIKVNDGKAELLSFGFYKNDNADLDEDIVPENIESEMVVRLVGGGSGKTLVARFTAGLNDEVTIDGKVAEGTASVDCSFPIDITVTDKVAGSSAQYVVRVGKVLEMVWQKVVEWEDAGNEIYSGFNMAINPKDNVPYFAYTRKINGTTTRTPAVVKYENGAISPVGTPGMEATSSASLPSISFSKEGVPFVLYVDGNNGSYMTVRKLEGDWNVVGNAGFGTSDKPSTSYASRMMVDQASGTPVATWTGNTRTGAGYRTINQASFNGASWDCGVVPGLPAVDGTTNATMSCSNVETSGNAQYIVISCNNGGYYLMKLENKSFSTVASFCQEHNYSSGIGLAIDADKNAYILAGDNTDNSEGYDVKLFTCSNGQISQVGSTIPLNLGSRTGSNLGVAVDGNGGIYTAYINGTALNLRTIDKESGMWNDAIVLEDGATLDGNVQMSFGPKNIGYLSYVVKKTDTAPAKIIVYECKLEEDVLPQ